MANELVDLGAQVVGLQGIRAALAKAIEGIDAAIAALAPMVGGVGVALDVGGSAISAGAAPKVRTLIKPDAFFRMSVLDAVKKYLAMVGESKTVPEISDALNTGGLPCKPESVQTILSKAKHGSIAKIGNGQWGLQDWYKTRNEGA